MRINVFNFKKDWKLVEPHLKDSEVVELLDKGMLRFTKLPGRWRHLPLWNSKNGHGPWQYTKFDNHAQYALEKQLEDPIFNKLSNEYEGILRSMGVDLDDVDWDGHLHQDTEDERIHKVNLKYEKKFNSTYTKYLPKINTYRWYQCFGGCFFLAEWQEALAKKVFPKYDWITYQKRKKNATSYSAGHSTTLGFPPRGNCLIFDILLFETNSADEILEAVGLNLGKIEKIALSYKLQPQKQGQKRKAAA